MVSDATLVTRLGRLCKRWGGSLDSVSEKAYAELKESEPDGHFSEAPFSSHDIGIVWKKKRIVYSGEVEWSDVTHEMGHVFACSKVPWDSEEWDFFGWELRLGGHV